MKMEKVVSTDKAPSKREGSLLDLQEDAAIVDLGYTASYSRVFGTIVNTALGISVSTPVYAILITAYYQIHYAGYWGLTWGWLIPNILIFPSALSVAEMVSSMPVNGAFYWWIAALAPEKWSRSLGFIAGWSSVFVQLANLANGAYAAAVSVMMAVTTFRPEYVVTNWQMMLIAIALQVFWFVSLQAGMQRVGYLYELTALVIAGTTIAYVIGLPAAQAERDLGFASASDVFGSITIFSTWQQAVALPMSFFGAAWSQSGWYTPVYLSEGSHAASRTVPRSIIFAFLTTGVTGFVVCIISAFCIPDLQTAAEDESGYPLFTVLTIAWGYKASGAFFIILVCFLLSAGTGMLQCAASQVAAFARDGGVPFGRLISQVSLTSNIPRWSATVTMLASILLLALSLSERASSIIFSLALISWYSNILMANLMRIFAGDRWVPGYYNLGKWSIPVHVFSSLFIIWFIIVQSFPYEREVTVDTFSYSLEVTVGAYVVIVVCWFCFGRKHYKGLDLSAVHARRL